MDPEGLGICDIKRNQQKNEQINEWRHGKKSKKNRKREKCVERDEMKSGRGGERVGR